MFSRHFITLYFIFFLLLSSVDFAFSGSLPIEFIQDGDKFTVINLGECIIYKLEVRSIPPKKKSIMNHFSRMGAELAGIGSFSASLGNIENGSRIHFYRSDLSNSDGMKLTDNYVLGSLRFEGSTCGECGLRAKFKAN
ncbi:hypothetical protein VU04_03590 [Desulfobulbus sp. TB]|nr:hypothetical protein [Desulfobulbus sp. TB]